MTLSPGGRLGPYEIVAPIGAGGMGAVFKGRDTRLDRSVAIKILSPELARDPQFRLRLDREARTISQLNHPNICTLYDVGHEDGTDYLVMELIEGESLADRLGRGALPIEQVLRYGAQIADALDKAHRQGIVHRDLKPGNIMITKSGAKLLDFGLARTTEVAPAGGSTMETAHKPITEQGTILGTFQYMAPEQLEGLPADPRTDIFALGAVLYEMATGKRAFEGKTRTSLIAAILEREPAPVSTVQPLMPKSLDRAIRLCLAKDPEERWQSARDVGLELQGIAETLSQPEGIAATRPRRMSPWQIATIVLALLLAGAIAWIVSGRGAEENARHAIRSSITSSAGAPFFLDWEGTGGLTVSPDGRWITFEVWGADDEPILHIRRIDELESRPLVGAQGAVYPFWSPDSRSIGFFADGKLKRVEVGGGPAITICDAPQARGGTWSRDGVILFAPEWRAAIYRVPAAGGTPVQVTRLEEGKATTHRFPWMLPDGEHFLYFSGSHVADAKSDLHEIRIASISGDRDELVIRARSNVVHVPGYLLFVRDRYLLAQPFDEAARRTTGDPIRIADEILYKTGFFHAGFSASQEGTLLYATGAETPPYQLVRVDQSGKEVASVEEPAFVDGSFYLSRDGSKIVVPLDDPSDLWIIDLEQGLRTRLTSAPMNDYAPVFSPDASRVVYTTDVMTAGSFDILGKRVDGSGEPELVYSGGERAVFVSDWSADGRFLLVGLEKPTGVRGDSSDFAVLPAEGEGTPRMLLESQFALAGARFSPDGRWVSFTSDETGEREVYVTPFPGPGPRRRVSTGGTRFLHAMWTRGGSELLYVDPENRVISIKVEGERFAPPVTLYQLPAGVDFIEAFEDGSGFIELRRVAYLGRAPLTLVTNWPALAGRRSAGE